MQITLHKQFLTLGLLALAALTTNSAMAQCKLKVPFNFVAAGKSYPAGTYTVAENKQIGLVALQGQGRGLSWMAAGGAAQDDEKVSLKFERKGDTFYLSTMQYGALVTPRLDSHIKETIPGPEVSSLVR